MEDNALQKRCEAIGLKIDRSLFYEIGSPEILQLFDGVSRIISKKDPWRGEYDNGIDGLRTITQLKYNIDSKSENPNDNIFTVNNPYTFYINVSTFLTYIPFGSEEYYNYDLREPKRKIIHPDKIRETKKTVVTTTDWSNIPHYPTTLEKKENVAKYLMSMGKQVPAKLIYEIEQGKKREIEEDVYNNFNNQPVTQVHKQPQFVTQVPPQNIAHPQVYQNYVQNGHISKIQSQMAQRQHPPPPPNKYSAQYAAYVGAKPRAQASARIGLGGAY
jgi:hypothetical protein